MKRILIDILSGFLVLGFLTVLVKLGVLDSVPYLDEIDVLIEYFVLLAWSIYTIELMDSQVSEKYDAQVLRKWKIYAVKRGTIKCLFNKSIHLYIVELEDGSERILGRYEGNDQRATATLRYYFKRYVNFRFSRPRLVDKRALRLRFIQSLLLLLCAIAIAQL